jgi:hypothetical protein
VNRTKALSSKFSARFLMGLGTLGMLASPLADALADAQLYKITGSATPADSNSSGDVEVANELQLLVTQIEDGVNSALSGLPLDSLSGNTKFFSAMANATAGLGKGVAADYSSNPRLFVVGANGAATLTVGESGLTGIMDEFEDLDGIPSIGFNAAYGAGFGFNLGLLPGLNLGPIDTSQLNLYVNFMRSNLGDLIDDVSLSSSSFSMYAQYKLMPGVSDPSGWLAKWGGIDVGTGFSYSTFNLGVAQKITQSQTGEASEGGETQTVEMDLTMDFAADLNVKVFSIPVEVSTNATLFYALTFFTGLGMDLNFGGSTFAAGGDGEVNAEAEGVVGKATYAGDGELKLGSGTGSASIANTRIFGGLQVNFWAAKLVFQGTYFSNSTFGGMMGLRLAI